MAVSYRVAALVASIESPNYRWNAPAAVGTAVPITYSFATHLPEYGTGRSVTSPAALSASQKEAIREALSDFSQAFGLTFFEVPDAGVGGDI